MVGFYLFSFISFSIMSTGILIGLGTIGYFSCTLLSNSIGYFHFKE
jgi:hypothetical protein